MHLLELPPYIATSYNNTAILFIYLSYIDWKRTTILPYSFYFSKSYTRHQFEEFKNRRFFGSLDGLRFFAILGVIWHHTAADGFYHINLAHRGPEGVTLFFAISGFLITTLLLREKEKYGEINLKNFYIRRTLRIFPLYYTIILIYIAAVLFLENDPVRTTDFFNNLIYYVTYTSNFFVNIATGGTIFYFAWTLATEEQFYLIWPWFEKFAGTITKVTILVCTLFLIYIARTEIEFLPFSTKGSIINIALLHIMPAIIFGVLIAQLLNNYTTYHYTRILFGSKLTSLIVLIIALSYLSLSKTSMMITHLILSLVVLSCVIREDHILAILLKWRPIAWMGSVSYGMYLMHMLAYNVVKIIDQIIGNNNHLISFVSTLVLTAMVASISFIYYESFFLKYKRKFTMTRISQPI